MPSAYIQPADYSAYGLPATTTAAQVIAASALIDAYLARPTGLVWMPDGAGNPAYMAGMNPDLTMTANAAFSSGASVRVAVSGPAQMLQVGDCVVLDRANPTITETVQVTGIDVSTGMVILTLGSTAANQPQGVQFNHAQGCTIESGLVITESRYVASGRSAVMLGCTPTVRVIGGTGRYSYGRRGDSGASNMDDFNLLASINKFGGPPAWEIWPANTSAGINVQTGELWVPAGMMLAYYSEVKVRYVAGFSYASLPAVIKQATAQLVADLSQSGALANFKTYKAADTQMERFASSNISDDVKMMLEPYRSRIFA
ncbi:hypothetical protein ACO0K2_17790 [Undibacterium sp. MH2W]|uniref:hypothetical protein n=1 Tax=Undibacterium sp. MH2W TaxID=3413044 RepID=UPI003BF30C26